jgi:transposase
MAAQVSRFGETISRSTIQTTRKREIESIDNSSKPRSGRPRVITEEERDLMYDIVNHEDPYIKLVRICESAHERSVCRLFADMNRRKWRCHCQLYLEEKHAEAHLNWAVQYRHFLKED